MIRPGPGIGAGIGAGVGVDVGVDVGGTKIAAGVVTGGTIVRTVLRPTPDPRRGEETLEDALSEAVMAVAAGEPVRGVGVAAAGFVDGRGEHVRFAPHLAWRDAPVRRRLADRWGVPVAVDNDATCAALAETTYGAARDAASALLVTVGTGIGGGLALDGRVVRGHQGMAGEFGHMRVVPDGRPCPCGGRGCWEQYSSGRALEAEARERLGERPSLLDEACGGDPDQLTGTMVSHAARAGDQVATEAVAAVGHWLGVGLGDLTAAFDPEVIVVGGGAGTLGDLLLDPARATLRRSLVGSDHRSVPPVLPAALGPDAGLVGAAERLRQVLAC